LSEGAPAGGAECRNNTLTLHPQPARCQVQVHIYAAAKIADLSHDDRNAAFALVAKITRELYDEEISELEKKFPALASDIDVRGTLPEIEQELWYLLEKYYPKKDEPPSG